MIHREKIFKTDLPYKISALLGTSLVLVAGYLCWQHINRLEPRAVQVFEQSILAKLDVESLVEQRHSLQFAINQSQAGASDLRIDYSASELQTLQNDADILHSHIQEQTATLAELESKKSALITELKITLAVGVIAITAGMVMAIFGFVAWYYHIEILEDRRIQPRE